MITAGTLQAFLLTVSLLPLFSIVTASHLVETPCLLDIPPVVGFEMELTQAVCVQLRPLRDTARLKVRADQREPGVVQA